jgi:hypothetical protein
VDERSSVIARHALVNLGRRRSIADNVAEWICLQAALCVVSLNLIIVLQIVQQASQCQA